MSARFTGRSRQFGRGEFFPGRRGARREGGGAGERVITGTAPIQWKDLIQWKELVCVDRSLQLLMHISMCC